jgi:ABC-type uncharacterized transport system involved in gliding motility auxiliary subunit
MLKKIEKYLYILSPLLIVASLVYFYLTGKFETVSIVTLILGAGGGIIFFIRFYEDIVKKVTKRKLKYGLNSVLITIIVLALVVIVYLVLMDNNKVFDLTAAKRFSLSEQTRAVLEKLEGPVKGFAFYSKQQDTASIRELFNEYHYLYKNFEFEIIDPDLNPGIVKDMGVEEYGTLLIRYGGRTEKAKSNNEEGITNALIKLSQEEIKKVYFITGHGEHSIQDYGNSGYDKIKAAINAENFEAEEVLLLRREDVPEDAAVLIAAGPTNDYEPHEMELIERYVQDGGRILFLMDPAERGKAYTRISAFLEKYGLLLGNDVIIDPLSRVLSGDYFMPVINSYTYNPITKDFKVATFMSFAQSVQTDENAGENIFPRIIANTGDASWAEKDLEGLMSGKSMKYDEGVDFKGPVPVMAYSRVVMAEQGGQSEEDPAGDAQKETYVIAVGDSDFITNSMYMTQGNRDLFLNTVNFLANRGDFITVRPKQQESVFLTLTAQQGRVAFFVSMILVPIFVIVLGILFTIRRKVKS